MSLLSKVKFLLIISSCLFAVEATLAMCFAGLRLGDSDAQVMFLLTSGENFHLAGSWSAGFNVQCALSCIC